MSRSSKNNAHKGKEEESERSQSGQWFVTTDLKRQFVFLYVVKLKPQKLEEVLLYSSC